MTSIQNNLALQIVKENFGEMAHGICSYLIKKKSYPLVMLAADLNLEKKLVAQLLSILIIHNIVDYKLNSRQIVEYKFNTKSAINFIKTAR